MSLLPKVKKFGLFILLTAGLSLALAPLAGAQTAKIVVTLKPIHSLVASLTQGISQVDLLLPDGASPHTFSLKPSHLRLLQQADLIIWVGPELELFMDKAIKQMHPAWGSITLLTIPNLTLLPLRTGRTWQHHSHQAHEHGHNHQHAQANNQRPANAQHENLDPHFWLSIQNAATMVQYLANYLSTKDPQHAKQYQTNAHKLQKKLAQVALSLQQELRSLQHKPFLVYHDGYQYFEKEFDLQGAGTLVLNPHLPLSAQGLHAMQKLIKEQNIQCVFRETEFQDTMIIKALGSLSLQVAELDPLGVRQALGPDNYENTMLALGKTFKACLGD